jgi:hypothetical protein
MNIKIPDEFIEEIILGKIKLFTKENYFNTFSNILSKLSLDLYAFKKKESLYLSLSYKLRERNFHSNWIFIFLLIFHTKKDQIQTRLNLEQFSFHYLMNLCHLKIKKLSKLSNELQIPLEKAVSIYLELCEKRIKTNRAEKIKKKASLIKTYRELNGKPIKFSKLLLLENDDKAKLMPKKIITKFNSNSKTLDYNNSYTRLFIGETDEQSIRERYLSNMVVKKQKELHLLNSIEEFSFVYLKKMYKKLFKSQERNSMDNDMIQIIKQFEDDHKKLDNLKRNDINKSKPHYMYNQNLYPIQPEEQKAKNTKNKRKRNKNNNSLYSSSEVTKYNNQESYLTNRIKHKNQSYNNSANYDKNKFYENALSQRTIFNIDKRKKLFITKKSFLNNIRLKRNFSTVFGKNVFNKSLLINNRKHLKIKNYLNKSDFFFSN